MQLPSSQRFPLPRSKWLGRVRPAMLIACAAASMLFSASTLADETRLALVIGNGAYKEEPLKNPVNDSRAVAAALRSLGFEVISRENATLRDLITALQEFSVRARKAQIRMLYYAGHGMQVKGRNYLIPVNADIASEDEVPRKSADVNDLLDRLAELRTGMNLVVLDACRNNPFNNSPTLTADGRRIRTRGIGDTGGLAAVEAPQGTLIAFSTAPGTVAIDSASQTHSVYTKHLLANIMVPGQPVELLFKRVRIAVATETHNLQIPWETNSLMGNFCFKLSAGERCGN